MRVEGSPRRAQRSSVFRRFAVFLEILRVFRILYWVSRKVFPRPPVIRLSRMVHPFTYDCGAWSEISTVEVAR